MSVYVTFGTQGKHERANIRNKMRRMAVVRGKEETTQPRARSAPSFEAERNATRMMKTKRMPCFTATVSLCLYEAIAGSRTTAAVAAD